MTREHEIGLDLITLSVSLSRDIQERAITRSKSKWWRKNYRCWGEQSHRRYDLNCKLWTSTAQWRNKCSWNLLSSGSIEFI